MTEYELWNLLYQNGQMGNSWWYMVAILPATLLGILVYPLMLFALRRETNLPTVFGWLVCASIPLLLILPSWYANNSLQGLLSRFGMQSLPADAQLLSRSVVLEIGAVLNYLATLGIIGMTLAIALMFASLLIGGYAPAPVMQMVQSMTQGITKTMTTVFGNRKNANSLGDSRFGIVKILNGTLKGTTFKVLPNALIGKSEATITITEKIISRRHARFDIRQDTPFLLDEGSSNGTYLSRNGLTEEVDRQGRELMHGDKIYLGDPGCEERVELEYSRSSTGAKQ